MSKNDERTPHGRGSLCPETERKAAGAANRRGRPERESRTPVNIGNQPYRDNGEGVAASPLPYPLGRRPGEGGGWSLSRLTDPDDTVLDIFAGSNTTGSAAEKLDRRWLAFEKDRIYLAASAFRFVDELPPEELATPWSRLHSEESPVEVNRQQRELDLMERRGYSAQKKPR